MNMVIDAGNTSYKLAFYKDDINQVSLYGLTIEQVLEQVNLYQPENILFSSVSLPFQTFRSYIGSSVKVIELNYKTPLPITYDYHTPETLGVDRLAAAVGANYLYPDRDVLVIDMGTCITYDLVDRQAVFQGGIISPGLAMRFRAMHEFTLRLPLYSRISAPPLLGKSTKQAMESGAINGMIAEIEGIIDQYRHISETLCVVICGGDASYFESNLKQPIFAVPELVLIGLNRILRYNVS